MTPGELRLRLTQAGFEVIPLLGKKPVLAGWQKRGLATEHEIAMWDTFEAAINTGILTVWTPVLNIDIRDPEAAEAVEQLVSERFDGHNVLCRIGEAPKRAIPFQTTMPFSKILVKLLAPNGAEHKIEFLGRGQQAAVYGIHPDTMQPYFWPHGGLIDFGREDLPGITPDGAQALMLAATEMLIREHHYRLKQAPGAEPEPGHPPIERGEYLADPLDHDKMVAFIMSVMKAGLADDAVIRLVRELVERVEPRDADQKARQERRLEEILAAVASARRKLQAPDTDDPLRDPDLSITHLGRRSPPPLPIELFGSDWAQWIAGAAKAAACPPDYVAGPLLAAASALIGNARWAQATPGWREPPHLWCGMVGDSGVGKSPGADCLRRDVLPEIEGRMIGDFPDQWRDWKAAAEAYAAKVETWKSDVRTAQKKNTPPPLPPDDAPAEPQEPRLRQSDVTIEKVATLLAAQPKGLLIERDELAGWLLGMNAYNDAGRAFWIEAYGGRPYRVERQKSPRPIEIPRLAVAVCGGTQPDRLAELFREADDGLLARFCWFWPEPEPFHLGSNAPNAGWAIDALDRLRLLDLTAAQDGAHPIMVALDATALPDLEEFGREMQNRQQQAGGLMRSAFGKARGTLLRLSLVIEYLWWCGRAGYDPPPSVISCSAFAAAAKLVADYLMPMAERVYGDAAASDAERRVATLARWVLKTQATEVHIRHLQRKVRLPGLRDAATIKDTCERMVEAGWLIAPKIGYGAERKVAYRVNPLVLAQ